MQFLEPQRGEITKPRPTAWVQITPNLAPALKGRDTCSPMPRSLSPLYVTQQETYLRVARGIPEAAGRARNCLRRAVRAGLKRIVARLQGSGIGLGPRSLAWASLDRPFGGHLRAPRDPALPAFDAAAQAVTPGHEPKETSPCRRSSPEPIAPPPRRRSKLQARQERGDSSVEKLRVKDQLFIARAKKSAPDIPTIARVAPSTL